MVSCYQSSMQRASASYTQAPPLLRPRPGLSLRHALPPRPVNACPSLPSVVKFVYVHATTAQRQRETKAKGPKRNHGQQSVLLRLLVDLVNIVLSVSSLGRGDITRTLLVGVYRDALLTAVSEVTEVAVRLSWPSVVESSA